MKTIRNIVIYTWAVLCMILIPVTFVRSTGFSEMLARLPFMKINPRHSGGEIGRVYEHNNLKITVNKPVFDALIGESRKGFVQVRFSPADSLPPFISDTIDFDNNGTPDLALAIDTKTGQSSLQPIDKNVLDLNISSKVKKDWVVRVNLLNPGRK